MQSGDEIIGCCIYHSETTPSFRINPNKGFSYCFGGHCLTHRWDPVQLLADVMGSGRQQAIRQLKGRFGVSLPAAYAQNIAKIEENEALKEVLFRVMNLELRDALAQPDDPVFAYIVDSKLIPWFRERKIPEDSIHQLPIGVVPTRERLYQRLGEEIQNGDSYREPAYNYLKEYLSLPGNPPIAEGWIAFFYYSSPSTIGRIKIRQPMSHSKFFALDDPYDDDMGFFGLNLFPELRPVFSNTTIYVTEGDFDVLSPAAHQMANGDNDLFVVGTGGSMEHSLDQLTEFGFKEIVLWPDNDAGGVGFTKHNLRENTKVTRVLSWSDEDKNRKVKDIDDAFRAYPYATIFSRLRKDDSYQRNHEWAVSLLGEELGKLAAGDARGRVDKAIDLGQILKNDVDRATFIDIVCQNHGIDRDLLMQHIIPDDTPEGFEMRLAAKLNEEFCFLKKQSDGKDVNLTAWCNRSKTMQTFQLNAMTSLDSKLALALGPLDKYVRTEIGEPAFITYKPGTKGRDIPRTSSEKMQAIVYHFRQGLVAVSQDVKHAERLTEVGQGMHLLGEEDETVPPRIYIVNGDRFFRGIMEGDQVQYEELARPACDQYIFRFSGLYWSRHLKSLKDIEDGAAYEPEYVFKTLKHMLDLGWVFRNQDLESTFLAADLMYTPVASAFQHMVYVDVTGEYHSGKSSLLQFLGGEAHAIKKMCEATTLMDDYSSAAVRQFMSDNRLRLVLDEFEDTMDAPNRLSPKSAAVRSIREAIRSASTGSGAVWTRGGSTGTGTSGRINFPVTVGGLVTMTDPRDLSRFIHIHTKFMSGREKPSDYIKRAYSEEKIRELRRMVTLSLLPRLPQLMKAYSDIKQEFAGNATLPAGMYSRLSDNYFPAAAVLKIAGQDYAKFLRDYSEIKLTEMVAEGGAAPEYTRIWNALLHTNVTITQHDRDKSNVASLATIISSPEADYILHDTNLGAYYLRDRKWLIIFWHKAINTILKYSNEFRGTATHYHLKATADADPRVVPREKLMRSGFMKKEVWERIGTCVTVDEISVIDLTETLSIHEDEKLSTEPAIRDEEERQKMVDDIAQSIRRPEKRGGDFSV